MIGSNPYLQGQADAITQQATSNLNNNILPGINAGAQLAGGIGGSRQGIAQGIAIGQTNQGITNSLAQLYGNAYEGEQNRASQAAMQQAALASQQQIAQMQDATQRYGLGNQYQLGLGNLGLGLGNLALGFQNSGQQYELGLGGLANQWQANQNNFYTANRGLDQQGLQIGANLFNQGQQGLANQGAGLANVGQQQQQAGWTPFQNYANLLSPFSGLGGSQVQTSPGTSQWGGLLCGLLSGAQLGNLLTSSGGR